MPLVTEAENWELAQVTAQGGKAEMVDEDLRRRTVVERVFVNDGTGMRAMLVKRVFDLDTGELIETTAKAGDKT